MANEKRSVWRRMRLSLQHRSSGVCFGQRARCFSQRGSPILSDSASYYKFLDNDDFSVSEGILGKKISEFSQQELDL